MQFHIADDSYWLTVAIILLRVLVARHETPLRGRTEAVRRPLRTVLAGEFGVIAGWVAYRNAAQPHVTSDILQLWYSARATARGVNPYPLIGPGRAFEFPFPLLYPLPAAVAAMPLVPLSPLPSVAVLVAIGAAVFAWALTRESYWPLVGFLSWPLVLAIHSAQLAPSWPV